ncbi:efflux RND transporter periplasmic adaptor subunit [Kaarinaea lacus]
MVQLQGSHFGLKTVYYCALILALFSVAASLHADSDPISVTARPFSEIAVFPQHRAPAVVIPQNDSKLNAEVTAKIVAIPVRVGQVVKKGTVLVRLQDADFSLVVQREEAMLKSLQAKTELARYQLQRAQALSKQQAVSEELLKQRETELEVLLAEQQGQKAALAQAKLNLQNCTIRAPFEAIVSDKFAQVGELAAPGTPLLRIIDAEHSEVSAKISAIRVGLVDSVNSFKFLTETRSYDLMLRAVTPSVDPIERTQEVRLEFVSDKALPGSAGELFWKDTTAHLPAEYLLRRKSILGVFVVKNDLAEFVALPEATEGRPARVSFPKDYLVVEKGRFRLQHGAKVVIK